MADNVVQIKDYFPKSHSGNINFFDEDDRKILEQYESDLSDQYEFSFDVTSENFLTPQSKNDLVNNYHDSLDFSPFDIDFEAELEQLKSRVKSLEEQNQMLLKMVYALMNREGE